MLYVTTRTNRDAYTAYRTLCEYHGPDGGFFLPMRMPDIAPASIAALREASFGQTVAQIINALFPSKLSGWDVDFCIGKNPVQLTEMSHRIIIGEAWHNPEWCFGKTVKELLPVLHPSLSDQTEVSEWAEIAVRSAVLFGVYSEMLSRGFSEQIFDISVASNDLSGVMSAWYARQWGLPIGKIICCCNENASLWELLNHCELRMDTPRIQTSTPLCDHILPLGLERLLYACGGYDEVRRFLECIATGKTFRPSDLTLSRMRDVLFVSVISERRLESTIPNVYKTNSCVLGPYTALTYAGLLDYRSRTGENRTSLLFSERSPLLDGLTVCSMMGISPRQLEKCLNQT